MTKGKESGFTLIEVLIAATILFMVSATSLGAYQTTVQSNARAAALIEILTVTEPARMNIAKSIQDEVYEGNIGNLEGAFHILGLNVRWVGVVSESSPPPPEENFEAGEHINYRDRFFLIDVEFSINHEQLSRTYQFREIAWKGQAERI